MGKMNKGRPPQQNLSKLGVEINKTNGGIIHPPQSASKRHVFHSGLYFTPD